jgi:hypothetical protein
VGEVRNRPFFTSIFMCWPADRSIGPPAEAGTISGKSLIKNK